MEQPSEIKKTEQIGAIILLALIIILAVVYLVINPQLGYLKENNLEAAVKGKELKDKTQLVDNLKQLQSTISQNQKQVNQLAIALPKGEKIGEILIELQAMASSNNLSITAFSPSIKEITSETSSSATQNTSSKTEVSPYNFTFSVAGPYSGVLAFLQSVETNLRPLKITKIDISGGEGSDPRLSVTSSVETYYQK